MEKAWFRKGLGFNLCVVPHPMLDPYFGSRRLRVSKGTLGKGRRLQRDLEMVSGIGGKVVVDIQTEITYRGAGILNTE